MPFNIDTFKSNLDEYGYLQNNKYEFIVFPPPMFVGKTLLNVSVPTTENSSYGITNNLRFRIDSVRAPGIQLLSADNNRYGIGPTQKQPFGAQFNELGISFISDAYGELWQYWYNWLREIYQFTGTDGSVNNSATYTSRYKSEYATFAQLFIFNNEGDVVQTFNFYDIFPTTLSEPPLSWSDNNTLLKIGVTLSYKEYTIEGSTMGY
jgi:hypothetical protein